MCEANHQPNTLVSVDERGTLFIERDAAPAVGDLEAGGDGGLADPDEGETGEGEGGPVDERVRGLVGEDGPEEEGDGGGGGGGGRVIGMN